MKRKLTIFSVLAFSILLAGCPFSGNVSSLKKTLGPFQYSGMNPKLSFAISKAYFQKPKSEYASPTVNYTINIKQHNDNFPLKEYIAIGVVSVLNDKGKELATFSVRGTVENGVLSVSDVQTIYGLPSTTSDNEIQNLSLKIKFYNWYPKWALKPYPATVNN